MWLWNQLVCVCCWYMSTLFWNSALVKHEWCVHHAAGGTRCLWLWGGTPSPDPSYSGSHCGITWPTWTNHLVGIHSHLPWLDPHVGLSSLAIRPSPPLPCTQSSCTMTAAFPGCLAWSYVDATNATLDMERHVLTKLPAGWSTDRTGVLPRELPGGNLSGTTSPRAWASCWRKKVRDLCTSLWMKCLLHYFVEMVGDCLGTVWATTSYHPPWH